MIRFLHLADTHLGARHPGREPGDPYVANLRAALAPALRGEIDIVFHGGDLFHRSRPAPRYLAEAAAALTEAAEAGSHVVVVPGNHERGLQPARILLTHPRVHSVEAPSRLRLRIDGLELAVFGFPFVRNDPRGRFEALLAGTGWPDGRAEVNVFTCHQSLDGATVGPVDFVFRGGPDVIPRSWIPADLDYVALGHIHRHQVLRHPRNERLPLAYPGSTERTARAERFEEKGYIRGGLGPDAVSGFRFVVLPSRPLPLIPASRGFRAPARRQ